MQLSEVSALGEGFLEHVEGHTAGIPLVAGVIIARGERAERLSSGKRAGGG